MKYTLDNTKIKSNWFDENGKILDMGVKGFYLYISLFRFKVNNQENEYTFITSIAALRKETGYTKYLIFDLLKLLSRLRIISVINISRWDQIGKNKDIDERMMLVIEGVDAPLTKVIGKKDEPIDEENYYLSVNLPILQYYVDSSLDLESILIYIIIIKYSNNPQKKAWISIEKIAKRIGVNKNRVNSLIKEMNELRVLYSVKVKYESGSLKKHYEHKICRRLDDLEKFQREVDRLRK